MIKKKIRFTLTMSADYEIEAVNEDWLEDAIQEKAEYLLDNTQDFYIDSEFIDLKTEETK